MKKLLHKLQRTRFGQSCLAAVGAFLMQVVYSLNRWSFFGFETAEIAIEQKRPLIFCFWHGRMMMLSPAWCRRSPIAILLSAHVDGQLIARIIRFFGVGAIYGSTRHGGEQALLRMLRLLKEGGFIGITPDGPRGPRHKVAPGIAKLALFSGVEVVPVAYATSRHKILNTWDAFYLPLPFGRGVVMCGDPIKPEVGEDLSQLCQRIEEGLNEVMAKADAWVT